MSECQRGSSLITIAMWPWKIIRAWLFGKDNDNQANGYKENKDYNVFTTDPPEPSPATAIWYEQNYSSIAIENENKQATSKKSSTQVHSSKSQTTKRHAPPPPAEDKLVQSFTSKEANEQKSSKFKGFSTLHQGNKPTQLSKPQESNSNKSSVNLGVVSSLPRSEIALVDSPLGTSEEADADSKLSTPGKAEVSTHPVALAKDADTQPTTPEKVEEDDLFSTQRKPETVLSTPATENEVENISLNEEADGSSSFITVNHHDCQPHPEIVDRSNVAAERVAEVKEDASDVSDENNKNVAEQKLETQDASEQQLKTQVSKKQLNTGEKQETEVLDLNKGEASRTHFPCLALFLQNTGNNSQNHYNQLEREGITTVEQLKKKPYVWEDLKTIKPKSLDEAVKHEDILTKLGLLDYFPEKITLQTVMERSTDKLDSLHDVPWYFLNKMLMLDYRGRDDLLPKTVLKSGQNETSHETKSESHLDDILSQLSDGATESPRSSDLHPMDVLVAIFQSSFSDMRQILCDKMFVCKLGIPLVLPSLLGGKSIFQLWAIRNITVSYNTEGECHESSLAKCKIPIVSCVRLGKLSRSKSKFLNEILNGQSHDTFFHRDCANGMLERKLSDGLVETAVSLPTGTKANIQFGKAVMLLNLRGDGLHHVINLDFLLKVSNILMVMVDLSELENEEVISALKSIASKRPLLLILTKNPRQTFDAKCRDTIKNLVAEVSNESFKGNGIILDFAVRGEKNIKELRDEVVAKLNKYIDTTPYSCLEEFKTLEDTLNMSVDQNTPDSQKSLQMSTKLAKKVKNCSPESAKMDLLPLQNQLWHEWVEISKMEHRQSREKSQDAKLNIFEERKKEIRRKQLECIEKKDSFIVSFINGILQTNDKERYFLLKWLKFQLDNESRKRIPPLQQAYGKKWEEICQVKQTSVPEILYEELKNLERNIADASFGIEHLIRETGQAYEAVCSIEEEVKQKLRDKIKKLPRFAAKLLLEGCPLELMDGDAAFVPLEWVKAVLKELGELMGNDKKVFVLSVLGAQSSGKSTLLNTMFGMQFAVAAGRCTRGVYAQLVSLSRDNPDMKYDYILVLDTEGLKAPELSKDKFSHDNEIATLVAGIGDVTLINIKGENISELQDVLQIAVHAIVKMRLANESLDLQPTCFFLYQNTSATDATHKMKGGQHNFLEMLDKVTKVSGERVNAPHLSKLQEVIEFDISKHVWYFSDLWEGDPPMAPANPGYSDRVNQLKNYILTNIMQQRTPHMTISKLSHKIEDLWKGILQENFIFSLKNSLESRAYIHLEEKLMEVTGALKNYANKLVSTASQSLENYNKTPKDMFNEFRTQLNNEYKRKVEQLEAFIDFHEDRDILEQWKSSMVSKLKDAFEDIFREMEADFASKK